MRVQVDKPGSYHQPSRINLDLAKQWARRNHDNLIAVDPEATHGIQAGFGVHHTTALEDDVVGLRSK
jgi:hypothetical protein